MSEASVYLCGHYVSLESVLLAHTDLLKMVGEKQLCEIKSYAEFEKYIEETQVLKDGKFLSYANTICDQLGHPYRLIEYSLFNEYELMEVSFRKLAFFHPEIDFRYLNLGKSNLSMCDLSGIDLSYSNLCGTKLFGADCRGAKFTGCSTDRVTVFKYANFMHSIDVTFVPLACPEKGEFIGWKRVKDYLVKLKIPEDAKRSSATSYKCRCDKAFVLGIYNLDGSDADLDELNVSARGVMKDQHRFMQVTAPITYKVGEIVYADSFDEDRWNECSNGIHFFIDYGRARWYRNQLVYADEAV